MEPQANHQKEQREVIGSGSNAAYEENICLGSSRSKIRKVLKKLLNTNKSLRLKIRHYYICQTHLAKSITLISEGATRTQISSLLKKFANSSGKEIPLLYIDLCLEKERSQDISAMGDGLYICKIKVEPLEWYQEKERLDLDLSVNESKIAAIKILQAAQKFAKMCKTCQVSLK